LVVKIKNIEGKNSYTNSNQYFSDKFFDELFHSFKIILFCLGVGAEGLGVNAPKPRLLIIN